jgi:hypothetical protein
MRSCFASPERRCFCCRLVVAHRRSLSQRVRAFIGWIERILDPYFD